MGQGDCAVVDGSTRQIVYHRIHENLPNVGNEVGVAVGVLARLEFQFDGFEVHGILDDGGVVGNAQTHGIHRRKEVQRKLIPLQLLECKVNFTLIISLISHWGLLLLLSAAAGKLCSSGIFIFSDSASFLSFFLAFDFALFLSRRE